MRKILIKINFYFVTKKRKKYFFLFFFNFSPTITQSFIRDLRASQLNVAQDGECVNPIKFLYQTDKKKNACSKVTFLLRA